MSTLEPEGSDITEDPGALPGSLSSSNTIIVGLDLAFADQDLENDFIKFHNRSQIFNDIVLAVGVRAVGWMHTAIKTYLRGDTQAALLFLSACFPSGLLPIFGLLLGYNRYISTLRPVWVAAANIMQFMQVGRFYDYLYPCIGDSCNENLVPRAKALTALISSNGTAFLILTTFMGSLRFKWLFITQCIYCLILIVSNRSICLKGPALRSGYNFIHTQLLNPSLSTVAQHLWPGFAQNSVHSATAPTAVAEAGLHSTSAAFPPTESSVQRCVSSQMALQLIFGLWLPCWVAYARELQARKSFVRTQRGEAAYLNAIFPSSWEMFMYALPAVAFPWAMFILTGTQLEYS